MHNAHLRMGRLEYAKTAIHAKSTPAHIALSMDRAIVEPSSDSGESPRCHLLSVFGGDQEIGAIAAALAEESRFTVSGANLDRYIVTLGERPHLFRSSIQAPGRKQPVRHLVALSQELFETQAGVNSGADRTVVYDREPHFLMYRLGVRFGLPVLPAWSPWLAGQLEGKRLAKELPGLGCRPVLVAANKQILLKVISEGLRTQELRIPDAASTVEWNVPQAFTSSVV